MPSLLDHIDRFNYLVKETQDAAERTVETRDGPSSVAMLNMGLGDLARDIDASELGLFTVVEPTAARVYSEEEAMSQPMQSRKAEAEGNRRDDEAECGARDSSQIMTILRR